MTMSVTAFVPAPDSAPGPQANSHPLTEAFAGHPATFTHVPRLPRISTAYPVQRWYSRSAGGNRIRLPEASTTINVVADCGQPHASLTVSFYDPGHSGTVRVDLPPESLRELARCLVDAAADIERGHPDLSHGAPSSEATA